MSEERPSRGDIPAAISHLVRERTEARRARDWARADELKRQIEQAGWTVVDHGARTSVTPAAPADVAVEGRTRFGSWRTVPSRLGDPVQPGVTVVTVASEQPDRIARLIESLATHSAGAQVVVVANDPSGAQAEALARTETDLAPRGGIEVVGTSSRLAYAAALNIGLHLVAREFVVVADGTAWETGDALGPLAEALAEPAVAVAGGFGLATEAGPLRPAGMLRADRADRAVAALELAWLGFRRSDYAAFGPLDEAFVTPAWLDVWWSFRLRAGNGDGTPRRAVQLDLPLGRAETAWPPERIRLNRRNAYRVLDEFGAYPELVGETGATEA